MGVKGYGLWVNLIQRAEPRHAPHPAAELVGNDGGGGGVVRGCNGGVRGGCGGVGCGSDEQQARAVEADGGGVAASDGSAADGEGLRPCSHFLSLDLLQQLTRPLQ
jgi:hypothetical protein